MILGTNSQSNHPPDLRLAAIDYHRRGWNVIPTIGKKPAISWKPWQTRQIDSESILEWFADNRITGIAVITGSVSGGLAIRDFDQSDSYHRWALEHPRDAEASPTVRTARGFHVYGILETDTYHDFGDGELRADTGHYTLLPSSLHPDGSRYEWLIPLPGQLPPLPDSLKQPSTPATQQPKQLIACVTNSAVLEAIASTLPDRPGVRNRKIFELARRLKAIGGIDQALLKTILEEWHRQALPVIRTKDFGESWSDFMVAYANCKHPHGSTIQAAWSRAQQSFEPIDGDADLGRLAALCRELAKPSGKPFYLACRTVSKLFGSDDAMRGNRMLKALQFYGIIEVASKGTHKSKKASTWNFISKKG